MWVPLMGRGGARILLALAIVAQTGPATAAAARDAVYHEDGNRHVIAVRGDGAVVVSACIEGLYNLVVGHDTQDVEHNLTRNGLHARATDAMSAAVVEISEGLLREHANAGPERVRHVIRIRGHDDLYGFPNAVVHTRNFVVLSAREDLHYTVWLPDDDRNRPGRHIALDAVDAALMWLNALRCAGR